MSRAIHLPNFVPAPVHAWRKCRDALARVMRERLEERMVRRAVQSLDVLDDRMLKDIGISRSEITSFARWGRGKRSSY